MGRTTLTATLDLHPYTGSSGSISATTDVEVRHAVPRKLIVTDLPPASTMMLMSEHQLRLLAHMTDGSEEDLTDSSVTWKVVMTPDSTSDVDWDATDDTAATIDKGLLATKVKSGFARIRGSATTGQIGNVFHLEVEAFVAIEPWLPVPDVGEFMVPTNGLFNVTTGRDMCTNMGGGRQ